MLKIPLSLRGTEKKRGMSTNVIQVCTITLLTALRYYSFPAHLLSATLLSQDRSARTNSYPLTCQINMAKKELSSSLVFFAINETYKPFNAI